MVAERAKGQAEIEFIIDNTGHAQLPRIVTSTRDDFGWAAATAVSRWQFTAPTMNSQPVDVLVTVPIEFSPPERDSDDALPEKLESTKDG